MFNLIDLNKYNRTEHFKHYLKNNPCTYSLTINLDITKIRENKYRLYPSLLYFLTTTINNHQEFRMDFNSNGQLGYYDKMNPSYTIFHKENETFSILWSEYQNNLEDFIKEYEEDLRLYGNNYSFIAKEVVNDNLFSVSMLPWLEFTSFNLNIKDSYNYLRPIFSFGKYFKSNDKVYIPLAIQVHHAVCDGYHVGKFVSDLQSYINSYEYNKNC